MCIWGVELQTEGGWRGEGAQTRSVPAASVSSRPTRHSPVPPSFPQVPLGLFAGSGTPSPITHHGLLMGGVSSDQELLGLCLGLLCGHPLPGWVPALPCPAQVAPSSGHCGWLSAVLQRCPHPWNAAGTGASLPQAMLQPPRVTSPGPQRGCELGLVCIPH